MANLTDTVIKLTIHIKKKFSNSFEGKEGMKVLELWLLKQIDAWSMEIANPPLMCKERSCMSTEKVLG